jgi:mRNA-degrading endonuclease RelE of RelBE toxin-antitoxin system
VSSENGLCPRPVVQAIRRLSRDAEIANRNRKPLRVLLSELPDATWELRVGKHRILYEVRNPATVRILRVIIKRGTTAESL